MAARLRSRQRVLHQRGADTPSLRQDASTARGPSTSAGTPPALTCHSRTVPISLPVAHRREGEAFGRSPSVAQALAGARMAAFAEAGIQQRFARGDVRGALGADRERSGSE